MTDKELEKEKIELRGTFYHDFIKGIYKNSIYKSIQIVEISNKTAFYDCEPYDEAYLISDDNKFFQTCEKIERAFKKYYKLVFKKYEVNNIVVSIYDTWSCEAGLDVDENGTIMRQNF